MRRGGFFGIDRDGGEGGFGSGLKGGDLLEGHGFEVLIGAQDQSGGGSRFGEMERAFGGTDLADLGGVELADIDRSGFFGPRIVARIGGRGA